MTLQAVSSFYLNAIPTKDEKTRQNDPAVDFAALLNISPPQPQAAALSATTDTQEQAQAAADAARAAAAEPLSEAKAPTPLEQFLDYMGKTPAERWREAWLRQHGYTEEEFAALPPEKKQALEDQMAEDLKEQARRTAEKETGVVVA